MHKPTSMGRKLVRVYIISKCYFRVLFLSADFFNISGDPFCLLPNLLTRLTHLTVHIISHQTLSLRWRRKRRSSDVQEQTLVLPILRSLAKLDAKDKRVMLGECPYRLTWHGRRGS